MTLTHGSLFAGIGGFDLGFEWAGIETLWQVEIDEYCQKVLAKHWSDVERFKDIKDCGKHNLKEVDIISGGFPCQDISVAGKQAGIDGSRSGLWSEMHRIIGELRPRYAVIENVPNLIRLGLERVLCDLAEIGYDAEWQIIGADDVGAPHRRKRIWIVAYSRDSTDRAKGQQEKEKEGISQKHWETGRPRLFSRAGCNPEILANPQRIGRRRRDNGDERRSGRTLQTEGSGTGDQSGVLADPSIERKGRLSVRSGGSQQATTNTDGSRENVADTETTLRRRANRTQDTGRRDSEIRGCSFGGRWAKHWSVEPDVGRVAHGVPSRVDRLKGLGNAIVPQIAEIIGRMIIESER